VCFQEEEQVFVCPINAANVIEQRNFVPQLLGLLFLQKLPAPIDFFN